MLFQAGESRLRLRETVAARDHFATAVKLPGTEPALAETLTMRLGETQALTSQYKEATDTYRKFLNSYGESKWLRNAQFGLGYALEKNDKPQVGDILKIHLFFLVNDIHEPCSQGRTAPRLSTSPGMKP